MLFFDNPNQSNQAVTAVCGRGRKGGVGGGEEGEAVPRRAVDMVRAKANIALTNLEYNICRLVQIKKTIRDRQYAIIYKINKLPSYAYKNSKKII